MEVPAELSGLCSLSLLHYCAREAVSSGMKTENESDKNGQVSFLAILFFLLSFDLSNVNSEKGI